MSHIHFYIGGSFDPVHLGHSKMALFIHECLKHSDYAYKIFFLPTARSPFKNTKTNSEDRFNMLELAIADLIKQDPSISKHISIDDRELNQTPPVYSIDTFTEIRAHHPKQSIVFVMGKDSVLSLHKWKRGFEILNYAHLWVFDRADENMSDKILQNGLNSDRLSEKLSNFLPKPLKSAVTNFEEQLLTSSNGYIFLDHRQPPCISSSLIRKLCQENCHTNDIKNLLSLEVWKYIQRQTLYR